MYSAIRQHLTDSARGDFGVLPSWKGPLVYVNYTVISQHLANSTRGNPTAPPSLEGAACVHGLH